MQASGSSSRINRSGRRNRRQPRSCMAAVGRAARHRRVTGVRAGLRRTARGTSSSLISPPPPPPPMPPPAVPLLLPHSSSSSPSSSRKGLQTRPPVPTLCRWTSTSRVV